jgi:hypothetical protein
MPFKGQAFGDKACHPERSEGSGSPDEEILRCAQGDSQDTSQVARRTPVSYPFACGLTKNLPLHMNAIAHTLGLEH